VQVFRDSTKKQRSLDCKHSSLNREGNDVKGPHASAHKWGIARPLTSIDEHPHQQRPALNVCAQRRPPPSSLPALPPLPPLSPSLSTLPLLTVQNRAQVHRKPTGDLVPFSPRRVLPRFVNPRIGSKLLGFSI
jgi:hypothetical protein